MCKSYELQKRITLEEVGELQPYISALDEDLDKLSSSDSEDDDDRIHKRKERSKVGIFVTIF